MPFAFAVGYLLNLLLTALGAVVTRCPFCGHEFDKTGARSSCQSCSMSSSSCGMVKCPNCGYEVPGEARLFKLIKKVRSSVARVFQPGHEAGRNQLLDEE